MNKLLFKESLRSPLPKVSNAKSTAHFSKSPRMKDIFTERKTYEFSRELSDTVRKSSCYERLIEDLRNELKESNKTKKIMENENSSLRQYIEKLSQKDCFSVDTQNREKFAFREVMNLSLREQPNVKSEVQENNISPEVLSLQSDIKQLKNKIIGMENVIKENKISNSKHIQDYQLELVKYKNLIESLERTLCIKKLRHKQLKESIKCLENQKRSFINSIKDLELENLELKQSQNVDYLQERAKLVSRINELEIEIPFLSQKIKNLEMGLSEKNKYEDINTELMKKCKKLEEKAEAENHAYFMEKFRANWKVNDNETELKENPCENKEETIKFPMKRSITSKINKTSNQSSDSKSKFLTPLTVKGEIHSEKSPSGSTSKFSEKNCTLTVIHSRSRSEIQSS